MVSEIFQKCAKLFSSRDMPPVMRIKEKKRKQNKTVNPYREST